MKKSFFGRVVAAVVAVAIFTTGIVIAAGAMRGDLSGDGYITAADVVTLLKHINNSQSLQDTQLCDVNGDGNINIQDVIRLLNHVNGSDYFDGTADDSAPPVDTDGDSINIWLFGGQMMGSYNLAATLRELIKQGTGKVVNMDASYLEHNNASSTWNVYELFDSSARGNIDDMTFAKGSSAELTEERLTQNKYDCLVIQTGRDHSLGPNNTSYKNDHNPKSVCKLAKLAYEQNPDVKILLVAPYGHQAGWSELSGLSVTSHSQHVEYINAEAEKTRQMILDGGYAKNVEIISAGSLFESYSSDAQVIKDELFREPDGTTVYKSVYNRATKKGSYLAACAIYAAMFDRSPIGIKSYGYWSGSADGGVSLDTAIEMQKKAAQYVLGIESDAQKSIFLQDEEYSQKALALIATADAYVTRGSFVQYDDTRLMKNGDSYTLDPIYRASHDRQSPESATEQFDIYTNCAAFMRTLFLEALDYDTVSWFTSHFIERKDMQELYYAPTHEETDAEKQAILKQVADILVPGDLVVYRYNDESNGHIMMYIGNDTMVHSTGSNYNYDTPKEVGETYGSIRYDSLSEYLLTKGTSRYLMDMSRFAVLRPLKLVTTDIPQRTLDRMEGMEGVQAQLLSSCPVGITVNSGDQITYTVKITNTNSEKMTVAVNSTLPAGVAYVSGGDSKSGNTLSWNIELLSGRSTSFSYTVRVTASTGSKIASPVTTANGVPLSCSDIYVQNTLTASQQAAIDTAARAKLGTVTTMANLINSVYTTVTGKSAGLSAETSALSNYFTSNTKSSNYYDLKSGVSTMVQKLYGGHRVTDAKHMDARTRILKPYMVMPGDVIFTSKTTASTGVYYLVLSGGELMTVQEGKAVIMDAKSSESFMASILGNYTFCVLRPSMG